jgi:MoxR-like ATPase
MKKIDKVVNYLLSHNPEKTVYTRTELNEASGVVTGSALSGAMYKTLRSVGRGLYDITNESTVISDELSLDNNKEDIVVSDVVQNYIPTKSSQFVKWGNYKDIETIIKSDMFLPTYITGESGNGKTMSVTQACAINKREVIRINFTSETCEEDLLGGYTLVNGDTVWKDGPVVVAMKRGAVCLLDEFDLANPNRITCLNAVLEGSPLFVKRTGELVQPARGFTIVATANTKGKGGSGRYVGTNVQNEAVLDRFSITIEQNYAGTAVEKRILTNMLSSIKSTITEDDKEFIVKLVGFAGIIRVTYDEDGVDELLSTRRLIDIVKTYVTFGGDRAKAVEYGTNRFDEDTRGAFKTLYENLDERLNAETEMQPEIESEMNVEDF